MARREWTLRFPCGHDGCRESSNYRYPTKRDLMESFERKHYSDGRWKCIRHSRHDEVLSAKNTETRIELLVKETPHGRFFGHNGFVFGPGFKAFAKDFPPGSKIIVSAVLVLPSDGVGVSVEVGE